MYSGTTAEANTVIGHSAGNAITTGSNNTLVGGRSDSGINTGAGFALTTGGYNNLFGGSAGGAITTGSKNTILGNYTGNQGGLDIRTSSNYIVLSDGDGNPRAIYGSTGSYSSWSFSQQSTPYRINSADAVQIDSNANGYGLAVTGTSGTTAVRFYNQTNSSFVGSISFTGTTTTYATSSDRRLKSNIASITTAQSGPIIDALQPRSFIWNVDGSADVGFIADEVQTVIPNAVIGKVNAVDAEGKPVYQMVDMSQPELIAYLVAEVQSLRKRLANAGIA